MGSLPAFEHLRLNLYSVLLGFLWGKFWPSWLLPYTSTCIPFINLINMNFGPKWRLEKTLFIWIFKTAGGWNVWKIILFLSILYRSYNWHPFIQNSSSVIILAVTIEQPKGYLQFFFSERKATFLKQKKNVKLELIKAIEL